MKKNLIILLISILLVGCMEKRTNDAIQAYTYWVGMKPPSELELLHGQYWESAHWSKEYILFLKFKPTQLWLKEFQAQNNLIEEKGEWTKPDNAPSWFEPSKNSIRYSPDDGFFDQSRYFYDSKTGICYIYEIQL